MKCTNMKNVRAKRAKLLLYTVKDANLSLLLPSSSWLLKLTVSIFQQHLSFFSSLKEIKCYCSLREIFDSDSLLFLRNFPRLYSLICIRTSKFSPSVIKGNLPSQVEINIRDSSLSFSVYDVFVNCIVYIFPLHFFGEWLVTE